MHQIAAVAEPEARLAGMGDFAANDAAIASIPD
jgi:hypothetical protein